MNTTESLPGNAVATPQDRKREELRGKIAAGEARLANRSLGEYARDARDRSAGFVRQHPIATIGAALAFGALLAAIIPGPGRRLSQRVGGNVGSRASSLATIVAELGIAYGTSLMNAAADAARTSQDRLGNLGDAIGDSARTVRREATLRAAKAGDGVASIRRDTTTKAGRALRSLHSRIS